MLKRRAIFSSLLLFGSIAVLASQVALPGLLSAHVKAMGEAGSLSGKLNVQPLPGTASVVTFKYSKPNFLRIDTEAGFTVSDGKNIYRYVKSANSYTMEPVTDGQISETLGDEVWAWASFYNKEALKNLDSAKVGAKRTVKGTKVTEVNVTWQKPAVGQATLFFEDSGAIKGFTVKNGEKETLVLAEDLVVGKEAMDTSIFAFVAPADSKRVEAMEAIKGGYSAVQAILTKNCMPCHSSFNHKDGIDLSSYDSILENPSAVMSGEPEKSGIYRTTSGPQASMPKDKARLRESDTKIIYDWIKEGAKKD